MQILRTRLHVGVICLGLLPAMGTQSAGGGASWQCRAQPVEPCFRHHGRLSSQNGIALKLWLIGTTRIVRVDNEADEVPALVGKYLEMTSPDHSYIYGDFDICPLAPDRPGHLRPVCVNGAERLVVENLRGLRPAFRLLSTWPTDTRREQRKLPGQMP